MYDIKADKKLVSINEDMPLEAASLIKPFIAMAYLHEAEAGRKPYNDEVRGRMERMIQESDNTAADWVMRRLGGPKAVQGFLKREYGGIFRNTSIVEHIPSNGRTYKNKASARDYSRFLYALWNGGFPGSAELKRLMNLPNPDRIYTSAPGVPAGTAVYDKTGTTSHLCGNIGILVSRRADGESFPYIIVGLIQKERATRSYFSWMRSRGDIIRRVSEMAYEEIAGRYRFADFGDGSAASGTAGGEKEPAEGPEGG